MVRRAPEVRPPAEDRPPRARGCLDGCVLRILCNLLKSALRQRLRCERSALDYLTTTTPQGAAPALRTRFVTRLDSGRFDVIVCPPHALPALTHGGSEYLLNCAGYSILYNVLGMPAGVVAATRVKPGEESDRPPGRDLAERAARRAFLPRLLSQHDPAESE